MLGGPASPAGVIGRTAASSSAAAALTQAWNGAARTIVLAGEPGIGKTTLLDALAAEAVRRGGIALWGRADPEDRAYGVWRSVLRALPGEPDAALARLLGGEGEPGGEQDRLRLFDAVADALARAAADQPLLVILDDLHWADASSLRLLAHVVDAEPSARLLIACSLAAPRLDVRRRAVELTGLDARRGARADAGRSCPPRRSRRSMPAPPATRSMSWSSAGC